MLSKEEINKIMQTEGQVKGAVFQTDIKYIERHLDKEKIKEVESLLQSWGHPLAYAQVKSMAWYPAGLRCLSLLAIKETFNLTDDQIVAMGLEAPKHSFLIKLLGKFFISVERIFKIAPLIWQKHWTKGKLEMVELDEEQKKVVLRLEGLNLHPVFCKYEEGYFSAILRFIKPEATAREIKCVFRNDPFHEYLITWEK
jgi:hypothetical protein